MNFLSKLFVVTAIISTGMATANAGVVIGGTRVIYDGNKKEASIAVNNPDTVAYLIQSWVESPNGGAEKAPFIITPPLYRLGKDQKNVERIVMTGSLPQSKESLYWLNIKAIPSSERTANTLQIAIKTKIKLIYRPASLSQVDLDSESEKLKWQRVGNQLQVTNPSNYIMNFNEITVDGRKIEDVTYVLPGESTHFTLPAGVNGGGVTYKIINDFGGMGIIHHASV